MSLANHTRKTKILFNKSLLQNPFSTLPLPSSQSPHGNLNLQTSNKPNPSSSAIVSSNKLITNYIRSNNIDSARLVFDNMPVKTIITWNSILAGYSKKPGRLNDARQLFDEMPERDVVSYNTMLACYFHNSDVSNAWEFFHRVPIKDIATWNTMISGLCQNGKMREAFQLFEEMPERNGVSWSAMISGYVEAGELESAVSLFEQATVKSVVAWTAVVTGYMKFGKIELAEKLFGEMPVRNLVTWNTMISGYVENCRVEDGLKLFRKMVGVGERPNPSTFSSVLLGCSNLSALRLGKQVHQLVFKFPLYHNTTVGTSLISMYCKCGELDDAGELFCEMSQKDAVTWNSMISGYAQHGFGEKALQLFDEMMTKRIKPDRITFVGVLSACNHAGLVDLGIQYFDSMEREHGIEAMPDHYSCMVDLLGRAGFLNKAVDLINKMPFKPHCAIFGTLLGACRVHKNLELAEYAAQQLLDLDPKSSAGYVQLANLRCLKLYSEVEQVTTMTKGCINGVLDVAKYSSPVPAIGLYITVGSAVCMMFMLFDIVFAFYQRKHRWMPCRLFSLNSVTLTLLSICSKISVDITSNMPGVYDQLTKLTGTTLICVSMGFFHPSIGDNRGSECLTNMVALSIFVITVVVNISIQISTGLIYVFVNEHITVMGCMLVLLFMLWVSTMNINNWKDLFLDYNKNLMTKGDGSMLQRLKTCYIYGVNSDPQLKICTDLSHVGVAAFCMIAFGVLAEAAIASVVTEQLKFCPGISDYGWSMQRIVQLQILTIIIGCFAISFRWFNFASKPSTTILGEEAVNTEIRMNPILGASVWDLCCMYLQKLPHFLAMLPMAIFLIPMLVISNICCFCCLHYAETVEDEAALEEYKALVGEGEMKIDKWIVCKAVTDMTKWMEAGRISSADNLSEFLSRTSPSPLLLALNLSDFYPDDGTGIEVSSLSMALITKIMAVSFPDNLTKSLQHTFSEAYEIIEFIETRIMPASRKTRTKTKLAKAVLIGNGFSVLLPKIIQRSAFVNEFQSQSDLSRAQIILRELKNAMPYSALAEDIGAVADLINRPEAGNIQDLYNHAEQMFVDMLHSFLVQFPNAVFKFVVESPAEEFEERVALVLKLLWKVESLETQVQWLFPGGSNILSLMTPPQLPARVGDSIGVPVGVGEVVPSNLDDVILEV